ncbi:MAG: hypothetical protein QOK36_803 [Gaiellales bacterium]|nr:hypothetical protein [Gaiellales bacterium]
MRGTWRLQLLAFATDETPPQSDSEFAERCRGARRSGAPLATAVAPRFGPGERVRVRRMRFRGAHAVGATSAARSESSSGSTATISWLTRSRAARRRRWQNPPSRLGSLSSGGSLLRPERASHEPSPWRLVVQGLPSMRASQRSKKSLRAAMQRSRSSSNGKCAVSSNRMNSDPATCSCSARTWSGRISS